jgi:hypothetical protein
MFGALIKGLRPTLFVSISSLDTKGCVNILSKSSDFSRRILQRNFARQFFGFFPKYSVRARLADLLFLNPLNQCGVKYPARVSRPYYWRSRCHQGQFPADVELDIVDTEVSTGVRRMLALVGLAAPFDHGRQQMQVLAGLEVAIAVGAPVPILYVQMVGTGVPVVKKEPRGAKARRTDNPPPIRARPN